MVICRFSRLITAILVISTATIAYAGGKILTVQECLEIAVQNHPDLNIAYEDEKIAVANYRLIESQKKIWIGGVAKTLQTTVETNDTRVLKVPGTNTTYGAFAGLLASYRLVHPDYSAKLEVARKTVDMSKLAQKQKRDEIYLTVRKNYYEFLNAQKILTLRKQMMENYNRRLVTTSILVKSGDRPILDLSMAEVSYAQASLDYTRATNELQYRKSELLASMGIFDDDNLEVEIQDIDKIPELVYDVSSLYKLAELYSPVLKLSQMSIEIGRSKIDSAKAQDNFEVSVDAGFGYQDNYIYNQSAFKENLSSTNWNVTGFVNVIAKLPLYTGGSIDAVTDIAVSEYYKATYKSSKITNDLKKQIRTTYQAMVETREQLLISNRSIVNARTNLIIAQKSYESGIGSQVLIQGSEYALLQAELAMIGAKYGYLKSLALLSNLIGVDEEELCQK